MSEDRPTPEEGLVSKSLAAESLPEDLRTMFPDGVMEGTIGALLAEYFTHARNHLAARSYNGYKGSAKTHLLPRYAKVPVWLFTEEDIRVLLSEVTKRAPQGVREVKKVLSCAFTYGKAQVEPVYRGPGDGLKR